MEKAPLDKPALPPIQQRTLTPAEKKKREVSLFHFESTILNDGEGWEPGSDSAIM